MSFDNRLKTHQTKDWRKPYRHAQAVSYSCRNHGNCPYCQANRTFQSKKMKEKFSYIDE